MLRARSFSVSQIGSGKQSGLWKVDIPASVFGKRRRYTFSSKAEANRFIKRLEKEGLPQTQEPANVTGSMTLVDAISDWTEHEQIRVRSKKKTSVALATDLARLKAVVSFFGDVDVGTITGDWISRYQADRIEDGISPATANSDVRSLMKVLRYAEKIGVISKLPDWSKSAEDSENRGGVPTESEMVGTIAALKDPEDRTLARLMAQNGLRQGEAFSLEWSDVDFDQKLIWIGFRRNFRPKTSTSNRIIYPTNSLLEELRTLHEKRRSETLVFPSKKDPQKQRVDFKKALRTAACTAGVSADITPQVLRRFFATRQAESGVPEHLLQKDLGHAVGSSVTKQYYIRSQDEVRRRYQFDLMQA